MFLGLLESEIILATTSKLALEESNRTYFIGLGSHNKRNGVQIVQIFSIRISLYSSRKNIISAISISNELLQCRACKQIRGLYSNKRCQ